MPPQQRLRGRFVAHQLPFGPLGLSLSLAAVSLLGPLERRAEAGATGPIIEVVRSFCLSAFESELAQSGKTAPEGMANFACSCVADRISSGSSIPSARSSCKDATAKRYRI